MWGALRLDTTRTAKDTLHAVLNRFGLDVIRLRRSNTVSVQRDHVLRSRRIDLVFDLGANSGQYATQLRRRGFKGIIVSFEPGGEAFESLLRSSATDELWHAGRLALGEEAGRAILNVSRNSWSSSLLPMNPRSVRAAPETAYAAQETVEIARLDEVAVPFINDSSRVLVKVDVQGAELSALRGAERILGLVDAVEAELTVLPLYQGQALLTEVVAFLDDARFDLVALEPGFRDPRTGALRQLDGFFVRRHPPDD